MVERISNRTTEESSGLHASITWKIIGAARKVFAELGLGFLEKVYENALAVELRRLGLTVDQQVQVHVYYRGVLVGKFDADLLVEGVVIVELKAIEALAKIHEVQLVNYLRATRIEVGLLLNFGAKFEVCRRIFTNDRKTGVTEPPIHTGDLETSNSVR